MTITEEIEQLKIKLENTADEREQAEIILGIMEKYASMNSMSGEVYMERFMRIAEKLNEEKYRAWGYYYNAKIRSLAGRYNTALEGFQKALITFINLEDHRGAAFSHTNIGVNYWYLGNFSEALLSQENALKGFKEIGYKRGIASAYGNIGIVNENQGNFLEALSCYEDTLKIMEELGDIQGIASSYINIGHVNFCMGKGSEAISNYLAALKIYERIGDTQGSFFCYENIGSIYSQQTNYEEALKNYFTSLKLNEENGHKLRSANSLNNIGKVYFEQGNYEDALFNYLASLKIKQEFDDKRGLATSYGNIGNLYKKQGHFEKAQDYYFSSLEIMEEVGEKEGIAASYISLGENCISLKHYDKAKIYLAKGLSIAEDIGAKPQKGAALKAWYELKKTEGDGMNALSYHEQFVSLEKELNNQETTKKIAGLQFGYQIEKKELEVVFERNKKEELQIAYDLLDKEKMRSESLLLNILPAEVAEELKNKGTADAKLFDDVTVLFTDFKSFTTISERLSPQQLVDELHECFSAFDEIIGKYNIEKIKTVGDAYLAAAGLPAPNQSHADDMIKAALEINEFITNRKSKIPHGGLGAVRIGVHSGSVVAGIVGVKKFAYDIWGDTVNTAARMEQNGVPGKVNISEATYALVKDKFTCQYRGEIEAKNKGKLKMYFVEPLQ